MRYRRPIPAAAGRPPTREETSPDVGAHARSRSLYWLVRSVGVPAPYLPPYPYPRECRPLLTLRFYPAPACRRRTPPPAARTPALLYGRSAHGGAPPAPATIALARPVPPAPLALTHPGSSQG